MVYMGNDDSIFFLNHNCILHPLLLHMLVNEKCEVNGEYKTTPQLNINSQESIT